MNIHQIAVFREMAGEIQAVSGIPSLS